MKKWILATTLAGVVGLTACQGSSVADYRNGAGTVALSRDDALVYAIDRDSERVAVVDAVSLTKVAEVKVGAQPEQLVVGQDDTIYVTNRGARSVSVIRRGEWTEASRIPVGVEPVGLAVSRDGKTLLVVNSTSLEDSAYGTLLAIDVASQQAKWELKVGHEPRGIAVVGDRALITLSRDGDVVQVDLTKPAILRDNTDEAEYGTHRSALYLEANESKISGQDPTGTVPSSSVSSYRPRAAIAIAVNPEATHAYMPVTWAREDPILQQPNTFGGYYAGGGPCGMSSVATAGLVTYDARSAEPMADDLTFCNTSGGVDKPYPPTILGRAGGVTPQPIQGPTALVTDPTGSWLFVVNRETNNVAVLPTTRRIGPDLDQGFGFMMPGSGLRQVVGDVGRGPDGIAVTRDGRRAFVYAQFDHQLTVLQADAERSDATIVVTDRVKLADDVLPVDVVKGRELFFAAWDSRITDPTTTAVSCNTCHTEGGREDGHVWGFPDGPRQTPALVGRMLLQTAPFHWNGEFPDMQAFMDHTAVSRMGGEGLSADALAQINAYVDWTAPADNPNRLAQPSEAQLRGAKLFQQAGCNSCHSGQALTNNGFADVGTLTSHDVPAKMPNGLNVPSLLGIARTAPYLHDGSAETLEARIVRNPGDAHGTTSNLSEDQVADLVAYLKTL